MIQQPPVLATSPAGLTNATTNTTGQTVNVSVDSNGATMANYWLNGVSVATSAAQFMITVPAGGTVALQYTVQTPIWYWSSLTPALPASTVAATNTTGKNLSVAAFGGTTTFWFVNGVQVATTTPASTLGTAPLALALPPGATISCTYSVAPVWTWMDYLDMGVLANSNGSVYAGPNTVAPSGATGYNPLGSLAYPVHSGMSAAGFGAGVANLAMSQYPRRVLTDVSVTWDRHANGVPVVTFTRHGTVADVVPGGLLEAAYGSQNLSAVIPVSQRGNEACLSKASVSN